MAKKKEIPKNVTYRVEFHTPDFMASSIATNIVVQKYNENFKLSFYEIKPDIIFSDEDRKKMEQRGTIRADCVGSFIITPGSLKTFADVTNEHLSKYGKSKEESSV